MITGRRIDTIHGKVIMMFKRCDICAVSEGPKMNAVVLNVSSGTSKQQRLVWDVCDACILKVKAAFAVEPRNVMEGKDKV